MTCLAQCEQAQASSCSTEADAYARCVIARPDSDLECDEDGETNLKDGVCEAEFEAALACAVGGG